MKIIYGIYAHPDDEAFSAAGTYLLESQAGSEIHLITLTAGEHGANPDQSSDLGKIRLDEWRRASDLIKASTTTCMGYAE